MFADRIQYLKASGIRRLFELSSQMKNPIDLSLGQPDFDVPESVKAATIEAIRNGKNGYAPSAGIPELRSALSQKLREEGILTSDQVMVTSGASGGLFLSLMALADEKCDVYMGDPYFVAYPQIIRLAGAETVKIDTYPSFKITPSSLSACVQQRENFLKEGGKFISRKKILLFNTPGNPTGVSYTSEEIQALVKTCQDLEIQVISDEVYDKFSFDQPHTSWLQFDPSAVLVRAFSKTAGMPGWRIGYASAPEPILQAMIKLQQFSFVCINTPAQWGCLKLLDLDFKPMLNEYRERRDFLCSLLGPHFDLVRPTGSFFAFPSFKGDPELFIKECLNREVLIVPGNTFSDRNSHFRISFSAHHDLLKKGIGILNTIAEELISKS